MNGSVLKACCFLLALNHAKTRLAGILYIAFGETEMMQWYGMEIPLPPGGGLGMTRLPWLAVEGMRRGVLLENQNKKENLNQNAPPHSL